MPPLRLLRGLFPLTGKLGQEGESKCNQKVNKGKFPGNWGDKEVHPIGKAYK